MKKLNLIIVLVIIVCSLPACKKNDGITIYDVNLGEVIYESVNIMGVTYDLYSNGYAAITSILHENAQIDESIEYNGESYYVVAIGYIRKSQFDNWDGNGVFGGEYSGIKSPSNLVLPDSIIYVSSRALEYSTAESIKLPSNLTSIGARAFLGCEKIKTIEWPSTLTSIGGSSLFSGCISLEHIEFPPDCEILFLGGCFLNCYSLKSVSIPGTIERLGDTVFGNCYELTEVILGDGIKTLGTWTFSSCPKLTKLVIPESVTVIEERVFHDCPALSDLTLPDNITDVPANLFVDIYGQPADVSHLTIRVRSDLVSYVQGIYPAAYVIAK